MSRPRPHRWVSIPDVTDIVLQRSNKVAEKLRTRPRRAQLQAVRRMVLRAERRDETRITKRVSGDIYVRFDAVEALLPADAASITRLEVGQVQLTAETRKLWRAVGGQKQEIRNHETRLQKVEETQQHLAAAEHHILAAIRKSG